MSDSPIPFRDDARRGAERSSDSGSLRTSTGLSEFPVRGVRIRRAWLAARHHPVPEFLQALTSVPAPQRFPLYSHHIPAGFPSPADDSLEDTLDLNVHLIAHPAATFFVHVSGNSMTGAGIFDGDLLIIDRSLEPKSGSIVVACLNGEMVVKRLKIENGQARLEAENPDYPPIEIHDEEELLIWGVVSHNVHTCR